VGTCFTITNHNKAKPFKFDFNFLLTKNFDIRLYIHNPGDEFWLFLEVFPTEIPIYYLPINSESSIRYINVRLKDTVTVSKNIPKRPCWEQDSGQSYPDCIKSSVISKLKEVKSLHCSTWISEILSNWSLPECKTYNEFQVVSRKIQDTFFDSLANQETSRCHLNCKQTLYTASLTFGNRNFFNLEFEILTHFYYSKVMKTI
jgi:hypothetical protein